MPKKIIKINIDSYQDRHAIICALTNNGFKVWQEEKKGSYAKEFYVCFEENVRFESTVNRELLEVCRAALIHILTISDYDVSLIKNKIKEAIQNAEGKN